MDKSFVGMDKVSWTNLHDTLDFTSFSHSQIP